MTKKQILLLPVLLLLCSCYPLASFQEPGILPEGTETVGIGWAIFSNVSADPDTSQNEAVFTDFSVSFRRGLTQNTELGLKFTGLPWRGGAVQSDVKWQVLEKPIPVTLDFGISYWNYSSNDQFVGLHPGILIGNETFFVNLSINRLASQNMVSNTEGLVLGRQITLEDEKYILTPFLGLHRNPEQPKDIYYSIGFGFKQSLDGWDLR